MNDKRKSKDVLPVPIKTSGAVPMPTENDDVQRYAMDANELRKDPNWKRAATGLEKTEVRKWRVTKGTSTGIVNGATHADAVRRAAQIGFKDPDSVVMQEKFSDSKRGMDADKYWLDVERNGKIHRVHFATESSRAEAAKRFGSAVKGKGEQATDRKRAKDSFAKLPTQHAGSEPKDHMLRANQYEVQGDRARALDSYRAAASGYRRSNDRANESKAREGIDACQAVFAQQYSHPAAGRVKVCDSAEAALRSAIERTRAGEAVRITDSKTVRPGRAKDDTDGPPPVDNPVEPDTPSPVPDAARDEHEGLLKYMVSLKTGRAVVEAENKSKAAKIAAQQYGAAFVRVLGLMNGVGKDEHEGFKKLEGKLSREKGVTDPAALAASIGRKKYGAEGMAKKSAAARDADSLEVQIDKLVAAIAKSAAKTDADSYGEREFRTRMEQERQRLTRNLSKARDSKEVQPV